MPSTTRTVASALVGAATVAAHGYVSNVVVNGVSYEGYDVTKYPYQDGPANVIGWATSATDLGFVEPADFAGPDIICHRDGENAPGYAEVNAGDEIYLQWNTWPDSHSGPVIDYLASCGDVGCDSVEKTDLEFFKIAEKGLTDASNVDYGTPALFATDELLGNGVGWMVRIPEDIAPGNYVLRHEIIALHSANEANGAQNYPQCFNLLINGSGSNKPAGTKGTELYAAEDKGIHYDLYNKQTKYPIPGPELIAGASAVEQSSSAIKESATATLGSGKPAQSNTSPDAGEGDNDSGNATTDSPAPTAPPTNDLPENDGPAPSFSTISTGPSSTSAEKAEPTAADPVEEPEQPEQPGNSKPGKPGKGKGKGKGKDTCKLKKRSDKLARRAAAL